MNNIQYTYSNFRLPKVDKIYYENQMQDFSNTLAYRIDTDVKSIHFGKQDMRGALSITVFDQRHCVSMQRHFSSKDDMMGYIVGFNQGNSGLKYL